MEFLWNIRKPQENILLDLNKCCDQSSSLGNFHFISAPSSCDSGKPAWEVNSENLPDPVIWSDGHDNGTRYFSIA